jgi:hypothetical protein
MKSSTCFCDQLTIGLTFTISRRSSHSTTLVWRRLLVSSRRTPVIQAS